MSLLHFQHCGRSMHGVYQEVYYPCLPHFAGHRFHKATIIIMTTTVTNTMTGEREREREREREGGREGEEGKNKEREKLGKENFIVGFMVMVLTMY